MQTRGPDGDPAEHDAGTLVSELSERDLAFATDPEQRSAEEEAFEFDPAANPDAVFPQSVASGGPTEDGVILWTRIALEHFHADTPLGVEVANTDAFEDVVYRGVVTDAAAIAGHDYTVKVDLDGLLDPGREYAYRFVYDGVASRTAYCRTLPAGDASPESLSLVVLTCQNYANGYYGAHENVAEEDVDFVVFVGDFIYESDVGAFKRFASPELPDREKDLPSGHDRVNGVEDYRYLYRLYRSDRSLQRLCERHTVIPAWDDHEIADDIYWDYAADAPAANHPRGDDPAFMTRLTADAIHVWWEFMPARIDYDPAASRLQDRFQLWREVEFGDLVHLVMTDERLFRSPPPDCLVPTERATAPDNETPPRTMLGAEQGEWFLETMADSDARWTVWSDEVLTIPARIGAGPLTFYPVVGGWDGYRRERQHITDAIAEMDLRNFITVTGDMHSYVVGYQQTAYPDGLAALLDGETGASTRIGVEFMTPALTSITVGEALGLNHLPAQGLIERLANRFVRAQNPHIEYFNGTHNGYSVVEFTRDHCTYRAYSVDKTVPPERAERNLVIAYRVPDGEVELHDVTDQYRRHTAEHD